MMLVVRVLSNINIIIEPHLLLVQATYKSFYILTLNLVRKPISNIFYYV